MNRLNRERRVQATTDQKALAKIEKAIAGIIAAIEDGMYQPSMKAPMDDLERQKAEIVARLTEAPVDMPDVHPNLANLYRLRVERLTDALSDPDGGGQAAEALRSLFGEIVLTPGAKRGEVHPTLRGELFGILDFAKVEETGRPAGFMPAVEASPRNQLNLLNQVIRPVLQAVFLFAARHDKAVSSAALKGVLVRPQPRSESLLFAAQAVQMPRVPASIPRSGIASKTVRSHAAMDERSWKSTGCGACMRASIRVSGHR
ncbi:hypothetical protein [Sinorhizobium meliloti]|uniref:hypothetical protein n=1 Tax=Rhizobium meliloti TaxID=382 RepID=UPI001F166298|nr:hypothetical protein [Sinorhizobium meliloti]